MTPFVPDKSTSACLHTVALILMAMSAFTASAETSKSAEKAALTATPTECPAPAELESRHLYGQWQAEFFDVPPPADMQSLPGKEASGRATARFERHPEHADSLRGELKAMLPAGKTTRPDQTAWLAGDVEDGELILDESVDGEQISAIWVGNALPGSCGKDIRGTRRLAGEDDGTLFILRKMPGWK